MPAPSTVESDAHHFFRKGGVGTYHMEAEYGTTPEYKNLRNAIQIMNPSSHSLVKY